MNSPSILGLLSSLSLSPALQSAAPPPPNEPLRCLMLALPNPPRLLCGLSSVSYFSTPSSLTLLFLCFFLCDVFFWGGYKRRALKNPFWRPTTTVTHPAHVSVQVPTSTNPKSGLRSRPRTTYHNVFIDYRIAGKKAIRIKHPTEVRPEKKGWPGQQPMAAFTGLKSGVHTLKTCGGGHGMLAEFPPGPGHR